MTESPGGDPESTTWHVALLGGYARQGSWSVRRRTVAISPVGGVNLDLTGATLPGPEITVVKVSLVGGVRLRVPPGVSVVVEGFHVVGRRVNPTGPAAPGAPTVHLHAYGVFGGVRVEQAG